jgi:RHS repeat-associated protein
MRALGLIQPLFHRFFRQRWLIAAVVLALTVSLLPTVGPQPAGAAAKALSARAGAGPVDRPLPASVRPAEAVPAGKRPPVVPPSVPAAGAPSKVSPQRWSELTGPARAAAAPARAAAASARAAAADGAFTGLSLRPGFVLGDTSLALYFGAAGVDPAWRSATVRLFEAGSQTEQVSTSISREDLESTSFCGGAGDFCRSFGARDGWLLDEAKEYFVTVAAVAGDGQEVPSDPSPNSRPRRTLDPPAISGGQAGGCGCGNALAQTDAGQASRATGVNTGTGAFVRVEQDLAMTSFGVQFSSARTYSSANVTPGPLGLGWAWSYDMRVTASADGALVRAEDGAEARYGLREDGSYARPPGVRSNLRRAGDGWQLVTPYQITYAFDGQGRLASVLNARGAGVRLSYADSEVRITDASGRVAKAFLKAGLIRSIVLPDGRRVSYGYETSAAGQTWLSYVLDAGGEKWVYRYHDTGLLSEVVDPDHVVVLHNEYGADGRVVSQRDALGAQTAFEWDAGEQESTTTDPDGVVVWDGYRGNVLVYSQRGTGDSDNHRYDADLNRNLVVNGKQNQHESSFDANGNRVEARAPQPLGFAENTTYDERNNPTEHVDGNGNVWQDSYNEFNELVESTDAEGNKIRYEYDDRGLLVATTDQRGKVTRYEYLRTGDPNAGLLKAVVTPAGRRTELSYDRTGRRIKQVDPRGTGPHANRSAFTTEFVFDAQDRQLSVSEPGKQGSWRTAYDDVGRLARQQTPDGATTTYTYFPNGLPKRVQVGASRAMSYTYTPAGRKASSRVHMHPEDDSVTTYAYDAKGLLETVTSPRGNVPGANPADFTTTYFYDADDNPIRVRRPYPGGTFADRDIAVDALDRTTSRVDELNKTSSFGRDNTGNVTETTDTLRRTTRMGYDRTGRQTTLADPDGKVLRTEYDEAGNKIKEITPTGGVTTWSYDDDGLLASVTEPRGNVEGADPARFTTRYEYDRAGNRVKMTDPLGHETKYTYDASNRVTAVTDAKGRTTRYTFRDDNQPSTVHTPDAPSAPGQPTAWSTVFGYDNDGLLTSVRDPLGRSAKMTYDDAGRLATKTDPLGRRLEVGYDAEGNATTAITVGPYERVDAKERAERTIVNTYDIVGRLERQALGSTGPAYTFGYDAKDRTTSYGDPAGVRDMVYDDEDQVTSVTRREPGRPDETFTYEYDTRGNITARVYPDGTRISAGYDEDSRITEVTASGGSAGETPASWAFGYDVAGRRTSTTLPAPTGLVERRGYDDAGRLTSIGADRSPDAPDPPAGVPDPVSAFQLTLDEVGNPTRVVTTRGGISESVAYAYDDVDRVTSACYAATDCGRHSKTAGRIDYTYDLLGNRTSQKRTGTAGNDTTTYAYDEANQLVRSAVSGHPGPPRVTAYSYDLNGNQTRAGADRFAYNLDNTLARAEVAGRTTTFGYDGQRNRLAATTGSGDAASVRRWSWDVSGTLPQIAVDTLTDAGGQATDRRAFTYGPDDEPLALLEPGSGAHAYTHDWLGGVANMLTPGGQIEAGYDYDPFGNPRTGPTLAPGGGGAPPPGQAPVDNPMRFAGAYQDSSTGEGDYHLRARTYDPGTGRMTSVDPQPTSSFAVSPYVYASNNPLVYTDPTGAVLIADGGGGSGSTSTTTTTAPGQEVPTGPSAEDVAKAQQLQSKSLLDVVLEAGGQILMEVLGINDVLNCLKGDLGACVMAVVGSLPWGKIFKAKKIGEAIWRAGKAVVTFLKELDWARAILRGAERAAEAAKAAAAAAARAAAQKAAAAKAAAEAYARKAAAAAAERAKAAAAKLKAATKKGADGATEAAENCARRNSFTAGTRVLLADGSSKPIEEVQPGDTVLASDPESGKSGERGSRPGARQVTHTIRTDDDKEYVALTVAARAEDRREDRSAGKDTITATAHHPFWSATRGRWVDAGDLRPGELLRTSAGTFVQVGAVHRYQGQQRTYNLTVDGLHTYYVLAGDTPVLVHNATCPHRVEVTVHDANGNIRNEYGTWSGNAVPGERALGGWPAQRYTDTENRVARMSGATPRLPVANDPYAGLAPVQAGETVVIKSLMGKAPCNSCKAAMSDAARQLNAKFVYHWLDDAGVDQFWWVGR